MLLSYFCHYYNHHHLYKSNTGGYSISLLPEWWGNETHKSECPASLQLRQTEGQAARRSEWARGVVAEVAVVAVAAPGLDGPPWSTAWEVPESRRSKAWRPGTWQGVWGGPLGPPQRTPKAHGDQRTRLWRGNCVERSFHLHPSSASQGWIHGDRHDNHLGSRWVTGSSPARRESFRKGVTQERVLQGQWMRYEVDQCAMKDS